MMSHAKSLNILRCFSICALWILLSSCSLPVQTSGQELRVEITYPAEGERVALGKMLEIRSHVTSNGAISAVKLQVNGQEVRHDTFSNPSLQSGTIYQPWVPPSPGTHALQVMLVGAGGQVNSNVVTILVDEEITPTVLTATQHTVTPTPITVTPTFTATLLTETPTITITTTPDQPQARANQNTNCRTGPATAYPIAWIFMEGQTTPLVGQSQDGSWLVVERLDGYGNCWLLGSLVTTTGNTANLPYFSAPPLPITDTPKPPEKPEKIITDTPKTITKEPAFNACNEYPDLSTCLADPIGFGNCSWNTGLNRCEP